MLCYFNWNLTFRGQKNAVVKYPRKKLHKLWMFSCSLRKCFLGKSIKRKSHLTCLAGSASELHVTLAQLGTAIISLTLFEEFMIIWY